MTIDAVGSIELTSGATTMLMTPSASTVGVKARLTPNGFHSTVIALLPLAAAAAALHDRHRELAAGEEARGLARQRDQGRLGERGDRALLLERVEGDVEILAERPEGARDDREAVGDRVERRRARVPA